MGEIRVALKKEVRGCMGYKEEERAGHKSYYLENLRLWMDDRRNNLYIEVKPTGDEIPTIVQENDLVDGVSLYQAFSARAMRDRGVYTYKTATAELELDTRSEIAEYEIHVAAKNVDDLRELLRLVKSGDISPKLNYDRSPRADAQTQEIALREAELKLSILRTDIRGLVADLKTGFPLCFKRGIIKILKGMLGEQ